MNSRAFVGESCREDNKTAELIETILGWPDWKIRSICVDQSDIALLERIKVISTSSSRLSSTTKVVTIHTKTK